MNAEFRTGPVSNLEWSGFWKSTPEEPEMDGEEWDRHWGSLREWLSKRFNLNPVPVRKRQCYVWDDYAEPERTLKIELSDVEILTPEFLGYVQEWLRRKAYNWRIAIPTDDRAETLILVYPSAIRINPAAEKDLKSFCQYIRPAMEARIKRARHDLGLNW